MYHLLYNPLSNAGKTIHIANKLAAKLSKKKINGEYITSRTASILEVEEQPIAFLRSLGKDDAVVILGGDGTINSIANRLRNVEIKNAIYLSKTGTGNDFYRSLKKEKKHLGMFIRINDYFKNLPTVKINGSPEDRLFLNGTGLGLDGYVCYKVGVGHGKISYSNASFNGFTSCLKIPQLDLLIDGKPHHFEGVWFCSIMNSPYEGGGMNMAPNVKRNSTDVHCVIVKGMNKFRLFLCLPLVFLGIHHILHPRSIRILPVHESIIVTTDTGQYCQVDGDSQKDVKRIEVYTAAYKKPVAPVTASEEVESNICDEIRNVVPSLAEKQAIQAREVASKHPNIEESKETEEISHNEEINEELVNSPIVNNETNLDESIQTNQASTPVESEVIEELDTEKLDATSIIDKASTSEQEGVKSADITLETKPTVKKTSPSKKTTSSKEGTGTVKTDKQEEGENNDN
jgi:diacylglycerol kinase family enzyme